MKYDKQHFKKLSLTEELTSFPGRPGSPLGPGDPGCPGGPGSPDSPRTPWNPCGPAAPDGPAVYATCNLLLGKLCSNNTPMNRVQFTNFTYFTPIII
jgi:hypothetical protein